MDPKFVHLSIWATMHGAMLNGVEFRMTETGCGVFATQDYDSGDHLLVIPESLTMSSRKMEKEYEELMKTHNLVVDDLTDKQMLSFILCMEKRNPDSFYRPYIDSIPESMPNDIINIDPEDIPDTPSIRDFCIMYRGTKLNEINAVMAFGKPLNLTRKEVHWAMNVVNWKGFVNRNGGACLFPLLDMVQSSTSPSVQVAHTKFEGKWYENYKVLEGRTLKKGDQLILDNSHLAAANIFIFCHFGFTTPRNVFDKNLTVYRAEIISALCEVVKGPLKKKQFREAVKSVQDRFVPIRDNKISKEMADLIENCVNGSRGIHGQVIVKIFDVLKAAREEKLRAVHPEFKFIYEDEIRLLSEVFKETKIPSRASGLTTLHCC